MFTPEQIAEVCHEANRALTKFIKDVPVQPPWEEATENMRRFVIKGVELALANPSVTPEEMHESWMRDQIDHGWKYGPVRDEIAMTHPALRPFEELPETTRKKDALFRGIVWLLSPHAPLVQRKDLVCTGGPNCLAHPGAHGRG